MEHSPGGPPSPPPRFVPPTPPPPGYPTAPGSVPPRRGTPAWVWWLVGGCGAALVGAVAIIWLAISAVSNFAGQMGKEMERTAKTLGRSVNDAEFGIEYRLPYGYPEPRRKVESGVEQGTPYRYLSLVSNYAASFERSAEVDMWYYPRGLGEPADAAGYLRDDLKRLAKDIEAVVTKTEKTSVQGHSALDSWLKTGDTTARYCRLREILTSNRHIRIWYWTEVNGGIDEPVVGLFLNSVRIVPPAAASRSKR